VQQTATRTTRRVLPSGRSGANFTTARCGRFQFTPARFWRVSQPLSAVDKTGNFGRSWRATRVGRTLASRELPTPSAGDAQPRTGVPARTEPSEGTAPGTVRALDYHEESCATEQEGPVFTIGEGGMVGTFARLPNSRRLALKGYAAARRLARANAQAHTYAHRHARTHARTHTHPAIDAADRIDST